MRVMVLMYIQQAVPLGVFLVLLQAEIGTAVAVARVTHVMIAVAVIVTIAEAVNVSVLQIVADIV